MLQMILAQLLCNLVSSTGDAASNAREDSMIKLYLSGEREADVIM